GADDLKALLASPHLGPGLRVLDLAFIRLGDAGPRVLAAAALAGLTWLDVSGNEIHDKGIAALARSRDLGQLSDLALSHNRFGPAGARDLGASPFLAGLTFLDLASNRLGDEGVAALTPRPLAALVTLNLTWNEIGPQGVRALVRPSHLPALSVLE